MSLSHSQCAHLCSQLRYWILQGQCRLPRQGVYAQHQAGKSSAIRKRQKKANLNCDHLASRPIALQRLSPRYQSKHLGKEASCLSSKGDVAVGNAVQSAGAVHASHTPLQPAASRLNVSPAGKVRLCTVENLIGRPPASSLLAPFFFRYGHGMGYRIQIQNLPSRCASINELTMRHHAPRK
jgi:hypothetical protein